MRGPGRILLTAVAAFIAYLGLVWALTEYTDWPTTYAVIALIVIVAGYAIWWESMRGTRTAAETVVKVAEVKEKVRNAKLKHAWALGLLSLAYVAWVAPVALQSMALLASKLWLGCVAGFWIDRALFDYARPDDDEMHDGWMFRRAAIVCAAMLGMTIGV